MSTKMRTVRAVELLLLILECPCFVCLLASSPGRSGGGAGKGSRACNCVCGILNICIELFRCDVLIGGDDISNDVITLSTCLSMFVTFELVSSSRWLAEIWKLSRPGPTGDLNVEFKFQRRSCKLSFLSCPAVRAPRVLARRILLCHLQ